MLEHFFHRLLYPITQRLDALLAQGESIMATVADLKIVTDELVNKVTALTSAEDATLAVLADISAKLALAANEATDLDDLKTKMLAMSAEIDTDKQRLVDATLANTPAEPADGGGATPAFRGRLSGKP